MTLFCFKAFVLSAVFWFVFANQISVCMYFKVIKDQFYHVYLQILRNILEHQIIQHMYFGNERRTNESMIMQNMNAITD